MSVDLAALFLGVDFGVELVLGKPLEAFSVSTTDLTLVTEGAESSSSSTSSVSLPVRRRKERVLVDVSAAEPDSVSASESSSEGTEDWRRDERREAVGVSIMPSKSSFFLRLGVSRYSAKQIRLWRLKGPTSC